MLRPGKLFPLWISDHLSIKYSVNVEKIKYDYVYKAITTVTGSQQSHRKILI